MPHSLGADLATLGEDRLNGSVSGANFGAHYRVVSGRDGAKRFVGFAFIEAGLDAALTIWEYDEAWACLHKSEVKLPGAAFGFFHDIVVTGARRERAAPRAQACPTPEHHPTLLALELLQA